MTRYKWNKEKLNLMKSIIEKDLGQISIKTIQRVIRSGMSAEEHNKYND